MAKLRRQIKLGDDGELIENESISLLTEVEDLNSWDDLQISSANRPNFPRNLLIFFAVVVDKTVDGCAIILGIIMIVWLLIFIGIHFI